MPGVWVYTLASTAGGCVSFVAGTERISILKRGDVDHATDDNPAPGPKTGEPQMDTFYEWLNHQQPEKSEPTTTSQRTNKAERDRDRLSRMEALPSASAIQSISTKDGFSTNSDLGVNAIVVALRNTN
jgi:hypothetical protein